MSRGNRAAPGGSDVRGSQAAAAATDADATARQPPLAKKLSTTPAKQEDSAMKRRAVEMAERWKAWKSKTRISPLSTAPWKSRQQREISTFPQLRRRGRGKVENQKQVSHFPTAFSLKVRKKNTADCVGSEQGHC